MSKQDLIDSVRTCLELIERMERELGEGARKLDEMTALLHKFSGEKVDAKTPAMTSRMDGREEM